MPASDEELEYSSAVWKVVTAAVVGSELFILESRREQGRLPTTSELASDWSKRGLPTNFWGVKVVLEETGNPDEFFIRGLTSAESGFTRPFALGPLRVTDGKLIHPFTWEAIQSAMRR